MPLRETHSTRHSFVPRPRPVHSCGSSFDPVSGVGERWVLTGALQPSPFPARPWEPALERDGRTDESGGILLTGGSYARGLEARATGLTGAHHEPALRPVAERPRLCRDRRSARLHAIACRRIARAAYAHSEE